MLKVTRGSDRVEVWFYHRVLSPEAIEITTGICVDGARRCSLAVVSMDSVEVGRGTAICNPIDNFCRSTGRKKALRLAMRVLDKELRNAIWEEYFHRCR